MDKLNPQVLVFACNWDGWSCVETAANLGLHYPASVKVVKVNCLSRVHMGLILKAFDFGAEGVMLLGCEPGKCHFSTADEYTINEYNKTQNILEMLGVWKDRLVLVQLPAFDGRGFVNQIEALIEEIRQIPPYRRSKIIGPRPAQDVEPSALFSA